MLHEQIAQLNDELGSLRVRSRQTELSETNSLTIKIARENRHLTEETTNIASALHTLQQESPEGHRHAKLEIEGLQSEIERVRKHLSEVQKSSLEASEGQLQANTARQMLETKLQELDECRREAYSTRGDFAKVIEEIESYARILEAMELKVMEAEERADRAEHESYEAQRELTVVSRRYEQDAGIKRY
jgi:chromosome segregation ATPase